MKALLFLISALCISLTASGQSQWRTIPSGTSKQLLSISFGSDSVGYIGGKDSLLLKTTNGGISWNPVIYTGLSFTFTAKDILNVNFISPQVGYAVIGNAPNPLGWGAIFKTTNGGANWARVPGYWSAPYRTFFFDEFNGYHIGAAPYLGNVVEKLTAGTWVKLTSFTGNPLALMISIDFYDTLTGITGDQKGKVYRTFDGGLSWEVIKTNTDSAINSIRFIDRSTIVAVTNNHLVTVIVSTDSGRTWQNDLISLTPFYPKMKSLVRSPRDSLISVGVSPDSSRGAIYWYRYGTPFMDSTMNPLQDVAMRDDSIAYAVGDSGLIVTNAMPLISVGMAAPISSSLKLYPNPCAGVFFTDMNVPHSIRVYDLSGRVVHRQSIPSRHQTIDLSAGHSGLYILETELDNGRRIFSMISMIK